MMLMRDSSMNMTRDATRVDMMMSGRDILNIMYDDIRNMGFKLNDGLGVIKEAAYLGLGTDEKKDSSSFVHLDGHANDPPKPAFDELDFIRGGLSSGVDTIAYFVDGSRQLVRAEVAANGDNKNERVLARNVEALQFEYADESMATWWFGSDPMDPNPFNINDAIIGGGLDNKKSVRFIRVSLVLKDDKQLAPAPMQPFTVGNFEVVPEGNALYERHQIVIPVPNNGVFPQ
ncbi:MAG: PilW family protein [Chitinispirillales bacterium]|nr:PilW family protein [Chitinispirillales bacterium]